MSDTSYYEVWTRGDPEYIQADQMQVDEREALLFFKYKESDVQVMPLLTTIAVWPAGQWMHVREITKKEFKQANA